AMGTVVFRLADGSLVPEVAVMAEETVRLEISVATQEIANNYEVYGFCLMDGFPNAIIPADYVVRPEDADNEDVIWINGLMKAKNSGIGSVVDNGSLSYDAASMTVTAPAEIRIYNVSGRLVLSSGEGTVSMATLPRGVYVAVSGDTTLKIVK
ncbi:MAG: T9SS type A sorting domain-containing protein, partial [Muribaculaceae bacterium]|nr:T9SS type A sorting domain-containing protein [Muribaculaceae bacterium]